MELNKSKFIILLLHILFLLYRSKFNFTLYDAKLFKNN